MWSVTLPAQVVVAFNSAHRVTTLGMFSVPHSSLRLLVIVIIITTTTTTIIIIIISSSSLPGIQPSLVPTLISPERSKAAARAHASFPRPRRALRFQLVRRCSRALKPVPPARASPAALQAPALHVLPPYSRYSGCMPLAAGSSSQALCLCMFC